MSTVPGAAPSGRIAERPARGLTGRLLGRWPGRLLRRWPGRWPGRLPVARPSGPSLLRDALVVLVLVIGLLLLLPRPNAVVPEQADVAAAARQARARLPFVPSVPRGLPAGWTPILAEVQQDTDEIPTWHVGYVAPDGQYVGFIQAVNPTLRWENSNTVSGPVNGSLQVAGNTWIVRDREDRQITNYVLRGIDLETIVSGHNARSDVLQLIESLHLPPESTGPH